VQRLLPDYIGDELSFKKKGQVVQHLEECQDCRAELAAFQGVWDDLAHQALPQKGEAFWEEFSGRVMEEVRRKRRLPVEQKMPLFFPGWKILVPVVGAAAAAILAVIALKGGLQLGQGPWTAQHEQEGLVEVAQPFSVAPLAAEDEDLLGREISLNGSTGSAEEQVIAFKPTEITALTEALTQLTDDEDIPGQLETLKAGELEQFDQLLSSRYPLS
jgi:hypothetical protein